MKIKRVIFYDKSLKKDFEEMPENDSIKRALDRAIADLKENPFIGRNVQKRLIPKKYKVNGNLWIYNLPSAWRMVYTITQQGELEIISVILDWMTHKEYDKLFKF